MKPPYCSICDKFIDQNDEGGLVYFKKRKSDIEWEKRMEQEGMVGHPPYAAWFCKEHYQQAKKLSDLTINQAFEKIKE